jgi:hypothetical protein
VNRRRSLLAEAIFAVACAIALSARERALAQDVATIAAFDPTAEIGRGAESIPAALGSIVRVGDTVRTGPNGRVQLVLADESVVMVASNTQLAVDDQLLAPAANSYRTLLRLLEGKVRALVSEYYGGSGSSFEIQSHAGVAGARGTDFVAVYDDRRDVMEVVGVSGRIAVSSALAMVGSTVAVTGHEMSAVEHGKLPTAPIRLDDATFRQYLEGLEFIGAGRPESLAFGGPLLTGDVIPEGDRADNVPSGAAPEAWSPVPGDPVWSTPDVSTLLEQPPLAVGGAGLGIRF